MEPIPARLHALICRFRAGLVAVRNDQPAHCQLAISGQRHSDGFPICAAVQHFFLDGDACGFRDLGVGAKFSVGGAFCEWSSHSRDARVKAQPFSMRGRNADLDLGLAEILLSVRLVLAGAIAGAVEFVAGPLRIDAST